MPNYPILRFQKCKMGSVSARYLHNERKKERYKSNPDINHTAKEQNYHLVLPRQTYRREVNRMIQAAGCKPRSNSTVMVETLITASPDFINALQPLEQFEYFERALTFVDSQIGKGSIIAATVHMDERTPHMHLTFCPITPDKRLSAKKILGNPAQLSQWQTDYHAHMSERWPELERGISAQVTKRKHLPVWLFKSAERLDKQFADVTAALEGINPMNAKKKRDSAMRVLERWMPEAVKFSARINEVDGYINSLEQSEAELSQQIQKAEQYTEHCVNTAVARVQSQLDGKDDEILSARREAYQAAEKLRKQANHIDHIVGRLPLDMRQRFYEEQKKVLDMGKPKTERKKSR